MSDNTFINIKQQLGKHFYITHRNADDGTVMEDLGCEHSLEEAVRKANEWDYGVEYGLSIQLEQN